MVLSLAGRRVAARPRLLAGFGLLAGAGLLAAYPWMPVPAQSAAFLCVAWATLLAVSVLLRRTAPQARLGWWLLWGGLVLGGVSSTMRRWPGGYPRLADAVHGLDAMASVLMLAAVLVVVTRRGRNDVGGLIDTTIVSLALGGLLWTVIALPHLDASGAGQPMKISLFVTIMVLSGVFGALIRLLETDRAHRRLLWLLITPLVLNLAGIIVLETSANPAAANAARMMFVAAYLTLCWFSLDPTAITLLSAGASPRDGLSTRRLIFLGVSIAAVPIVAASRVLLGYPVDALLLAAGAAAMAPLVMLRIGLLAAQRNRSEHALQHLAAHDPLTGVLNRRGFSQRLTAELDRQHTCLLLFCDLNGFKAVNDRFGHSAGDQLLVEITSRLRRCVRPQDVIGRYGGDEFLILFHDSSQFDEARLRRRVCRVLSEPFTWQGETLTVTVSVGAAISNAGSLDPGKAEELICAADKAMYQSKMDTAA